MNGKAAKRIRNAATVISRPRYHRETVKRLKREYKASAYNKRKTPEVVGHSRVLRRHHDCRTTPFREGEPT